MHKVTGLEFFRDSLLPRAVFSRDSSGIVIKKVGWDNNLLSYWWLFWTCLKANIFGLLATQEQCITFNPGFYSYKLASEVISVNKRLASFSQGRLIRGHQDLGMRLMDPDWGTDGPSRHEKLARGLPIISGNHAHCLILITEQYTHHSIKFIPQST